MNKNEPITVKQLRARVETYKKQIGRSLSVDEKKMVLDSLINERLILQAAQKAGLSIPDSEIDKQFIAGICQQIGLSTIVSEKELNDLIKSAQGVTLDQFLVNQTGMNTAEYKAYFKNQMIAQQYVLYQKQDELKNIAPTDEEIRMYYESNKASFIRTDMIKMFAVWVPKESDIDGARNKLNSLRNQYIDKKQTAEQMIATANATGAGYSAGEGLVPKTDAYAKAMKLTYQQLMDLFGKNEGYVSEMMETQDDFRFVVVRKKYEAKMLALSDVYMPESTITVYEVIRNNLANLKQSQFIQIAAQDIANSLNTTENVERKKTGDALNKLLEWGD